MQTILNIGIKIWNYISGNAFVGALVASLISWILIYFITEKIKTRNLKLALKKELATNEGLLRYGKEESIKKNNLERVHLFLEVFPQVLNNNLQDKVGVENYAALVHIYNGIKKHNQYVSSIEMGLRSVKNLDLYTDEWIELAEKIKHTNAKIIVKLF